MECLKIFAVIGLPLAFLYTFINNEVGNDMTNSLAKSTELKYTAHSHGDFGKCGVHNISSATVDVKINNEFDFTGIPPFPSIGSEISEYKYQCPDDYTFLFRTSNAPSNGIYAHIFVSRWNALPWGTTPGSFVFKSTVHLYNSALYLAEEFNVSLDPYHSPHIALFFSDSATPPTL